MNTRVMMVWVGNILSILVLKLQPVLGNDFLDYEFWVYNLKKKHKTRAVKHFVLEKLITSWTQENKKKTSKKWGVVILFELQSTEATYN